MSTPMFVDPESSTQADGAQSSRVPVPFLKDPYEAIRQDYLDRTNTESEPFEDPTDTKTPESPLTTRMDMRVPYVISSSLSTSMAEVAAMSKSALRKRFWSSYESSPSVSPPDLPSRKRYCEDESPTSEVEDPIAEDKGLTAGVESPGINDKGYGLDDEGHGRDDESHGIDDEGHSIESDGLSLEEEEEAVPGGQQQVTLVAGMTMSAPLGLRYRALRRRELALEEGNIYSMFEDGMIYVDIPDYPPPAPPVQTPPSPEWTSSLLPISPSHSDVPSPISSPMIPLTIPSPVATPTAVETKGFLTELGAQFEMQGGLIRDHAEFGVPIGVGRSDIQSDMEASLAEQRHARLELAEVVDGIRRGQEPKGGA
ncbi:hypothetical protein Tco_0393943 [Tanacetum coccineum]